MIFKSLPPNISKIHLSEGDLSVLLPAYITFCKKFIKGFFFFFVAREAFDDQDGPKYKRIHEFVVIGDNVDVTV